MGGRRLAATVAVLIVSTTGTIGDPATANLDGFWMDSDGEVILAVGPCGDSRCAKVAWLKVAKERGKPIPKPKYRPAIYQLAR